MNTNYAENITASLARATDAQWQAGMDWYGEAHTLASVLTPTDPWIGAGLLAAYSPLTPWWRNMELAITAIYDGVAPTNTLPNNYRAASRILAGEHTLDVLKGAKTRAFASAIALNGATDLVTVDSIAYSCAVGEHFAAKAIKGFGVKVYRAIAQAYAEVAVAHNVAPCQAQAIAWVEWRDAHPNKAARKA